MTQNDMFTEKLTGAVERITYFNEENGYTVLKMTPEGKIRTDALARDGTVAVVGTLPKINAGEMVEFTGEWKSDPKWGLQFRALQMTPILPTSKRGITRYLAEMVSGVGPRTAERIVDHFGEETLDILSHHPERLDEVEGLKPQLADNIRQTWRDNHQERAAVIFLQEFGVTAKFARRVYQEYGEDTIPTVRANPYRLADDIFGVGFIKADAIAQEMGWKIDSAERVAAGLNFALGRLATEGHTYAPRPVLAEKAAELLKLEDQVDLVDMIIEQHLRTDAVKMDGLDINGETVEAIYLPVYYHSERGVVRKLRQMLEVSPRLTLARPEAKDVNAYVNKIAELGDVTLSEQQRDAVKAVLTHKITVLTGGPGTGKTTTLQVVIEAVEGIRRRVALAAPTGRAAKRLGEATGRHASTIHRLLGFQPGGGMMSFEHDDDNPLEVDLLVLDETSMLDLVLFYNVLKALPVGAHLMLVGDVDQLPSVGAGNVLRDLIDSGVAHVTRLQQIFRQDARSHIVSNAHSINTGHMPYLGNDSKDFFFFRMNTPDEAAEMVVDVVVNRVPSKFGFNAVDDIQVLAPMYKGTVGVNALNEALQNRLNGNTRLAHVKVNHRIYRVGDKVMQTRNNYEKNVFNGDGGRIVSINKQRSEVDVLIDGNTVTYEFGELDELVLAYCISTHRSQGSEYPVVVMPIMTQHYVMLQRNLLYTAITRARKMVVLVGMDQAVRMAIENNKVAERFTGLTPRLNPNTNGMLF